MGKVVFSHFKEQLVLIHRVWLVNEHEHKVGIAFIREYFLLDRILVIEYNTSSVPYIFQVKLSAMQSFSRIDSIDYHTRYFADSAIRIFLYHFLHILNAGIGVTIVELAQSTDKQEFIPVFSQWETLGRYACIGLSLLVSACLECLVGCRIKRVFYMNTKLGIFFVVWICNQCCPLAFRIFLLQFLYITFCLYRHFLSGI